MIDHISIGVHDLARSRAFYDAVLAPLGYRRMFDVEDASGYGRSEPHPLKEQALPFWIAPETRKLPAPWNVKVRVPVATEVKPPSMSRPASD